MVLFDLGLEKSTPIVILVANRPKSVDTTLYMSVTMRVNYLFLDRPVLSFVAGSLARRMQSPTTKVLEDTNSAIVVEKQTLAEIL